MKQPNNFMIRKKTILFSLIIIVLYSLTSCVTQKDLEYFQGKKKTTREFKESEMVDYLLKSSDELYVQISSLDDVGENLLTGINTQQSLLLSTMQPYGASLMSYVIDKEGYLTLPVVGEILAKDKTLTQVSDKIKEAYTKILNQPIVSVKLVNRYISVLGEVKNPGHFSYSQDKLTIYDAIGLAGDITDYGNRKEITITRNENGKNFCISVNLTNPEILASEFYYIRPNDIIYIKPMRKRYWDLKQFPYTVILTTLTTAILIYNVIE